MILLTGGLGFIGSHMAALLAERERDFLIVDNLSNSRIEVLENLQYIKKSKIDFEQVDVRNYKKMSDVFSRYSITSVIHFAGLKSVSESIAKPIDYYDINVSGTINLVRVMQDHHVFNLVFSSSAAVYGNPEQFPIVESSPKKPTTPYGESKWICEQFLASVVQSDPRWRAVNLRYFNPVGAHPSGLIGENPLGVPMNLMPYLVQVVNGQRDCLSVFGDDYPTPDGTCIRDYLHVLDLVEGHFMAFNYLLEQSQGFNLSLNLGKGVGVSVLQLIHTFEQATGKKINFKIVERRVGDTAILYAAATAAEDLLHWRAERSLEDMCRSLWAFVGQSSDAQ